MDEQQANIEKRLFDYYEGRLEGADCEEVKAWIAASEENRRMARRIYSLLLAVDVQQVKKDIDIEKALNKVKSRRIARREKQGWWQWAQRAAAVLFIPLLSLFVWQQLNMPGGEQVAELMEVRTNPGMTTRFRLPDGTFVCLNAGSTLSYPARFTGAMRSVNLSGEAYFEVTKDAEHRFVVNTPGQSAVEVYGTRFNVEAYEDDPNITTTLAEGKVGFLYRDGQVQKRTLLSPGQKLVYNTDTKDLARYETSGVAELSWKDGLIIFENTPLPEALRMLGKRFNVEFVVKNTRLNQYRFTGTFSTQRLEKILKYFEISSKIRWRYLNDPDINQEKIRIEIY